MFVIARVSTSARTITDEWALECAACPFSLENFTALVRYVEDELDWADYVSWWEEKAGYGDW